MDESEMMAMDDQMDAMDYGMEGEGSPEMDYGEEMGQEAYGDEMGQEGFEGEMGEGDMEADEDFDDDGSINFDANPEYAHLPPLDRNRKIRREVVRTINDVRAKFASTAPLSHDVLLSNAAEEYAQFLLANPPNEETLTAIAGSHNAVLGEGFKVLVGNAGLEEEMEASDKYYTGEYMDAHGLLLELQEELGMLTNKEYTHIGVGLAQNTHEVKVVEILALKPCAVTSVNQTEDGDIEVSGTICSPNGPGGGLYAAQIVSNQNLKKGIHIVGPSGFTINPDSKQFHIHFKQPNEGLFYSGHSLEIYFRKAQADKIKYGAEADAGEKIKVEQLTIGVRLALEFIPDPRMVIEDEADRKKQEREMIEAVKRAEEEKLIKQAEKLARKEERQKKKEEALAAAERGDVDADMSGSGSDEEGSGSKRGSSKQSQKESASGRQDSESQDQSGDMSLDEEEQDQMVGDLPSPTQMKDELIQAIRDEIEEYNHLKGGNDKLQRQIILLDDFSRDDKQNQEQLLNEHKYLNTLANVHQVRYNLKETQDRYNRMASELQAKLNEKQAKCQEIENQFKELKRTVAQNAVFSRTGQKLKPRMINEWEEHEASKDQEVHQYRLQNIALRNRLANQEKIVKKKEQLADGLHMIDFEQLKIENQTLNDKIEERNDELHKLRQKIVTTVVILSHTREKYQYVAKQNAKKKRDVEELTNQLVKVKKELTVLKEECDKREKELIFLKQETGIASQAGLNNDHKKREKMNAQLIEEITSFKEYHKVLKQQIRLARDYQAQQHPALMAQEM